MSEYAAQLQKLLVDAKSEARSKACAEITAKTSNSFRDVPPDEAYTIAIKSLQNIDQQFIRNALPAYRRGGMASVRATVAGVPSGKTHNSEFIKQCCDIVLPGFNDVDPTVRLSALETAHEIMRKFQTQVFKTNFMELFRSLLCVMNDKDKRILSLGRELSSTVREFVTGAEYKSFPPDSFVSFITEAMEPFVNQCPSVDVDAVVVQWLLEWIGHVYDLPGHELVLHLPRFLSHLFYLNARCPSPEASRIMEKSLADSKKAYENGSDINIVELMTTSVDCVAAIEIPATRKLALEWTAALLQLGHDKMLPLTHNILDAILPQLGAKDVTIRIDAQNANSLLQQLLVSVESDHLVAASSPAIVDECGTAAPVEGAPPPPPRVHYYPVLQTIMSRLDVRAKEETRVASLEWIILIHGVRPDVIRDHFHTVFQSVLSTLSDPSEHVVHKSIETLHMIAGEEEFSHFIDNFLKHVEDKAPVLLPKAPMMIKQLQLRYQGNEYETCEKLFLKIAELLPLRNDKRFVSKLVIVLSVMLLTSKEFIPLREVLRRGVGDERAREAFVGLYRCWSFDIVAAIALCFLTTAYGHAYRLVVLLGESEMSPQTLVQVDRLVQLLESPVFSFLRIALLRPTKNAALVKSLFGLLMVLPQSSNQYHTLNCRLKAIPSVSILEQNCRNANEPNSSDDDGESERHTSRINEKGIPQQMWKEMARHCFDAVKSIEAYEAELRGMGHR